MIRDNFGLIKVDKTYCRISGKLIARENAEKPLLLAKEIHLSKIPSDFKLFEG
jgi:hypothetical protein